MSPLVPAGAERPRGGRPAAAGGRLDRLREDARRTFERIGFPSRKIEGWRYVHVKSLAPFGREPAPPPSERAVESAAGILGPAQVASAARLVVVNGAFVPSLSATDGLPAGVRVLSLAEALAELPDLVGDALGRIAAPEEDGFGAINTAALRDALVLHVPRGVRVEAPVAIVHLSVPEDGPTLTLPRVLVACEPTSELTLAERFSGVPGEKTLSNAVTEVWVGADATVRHVKLVEERDDAFHVGTLAAKVHRGGRFDSHVLSFSGAIARTTLVVDLAEEGASTLLDGLYVATGKRHLDHATTVHHTAPHTSSDETYKGLADDEASGAFFGRVLIHEGARGSETHQVNRNLLLARGARAYTRPQLEIDNDDVQATHGSTVGAIDEAALFYLRSRGIDDRSARGLLVWSFAHEMVRRLPDHGLRQALGRRLADRLASGADPTVREAMEEAL